MYFHVTAEFRGKETITVNLAVVSHYDNDVKANLGKRNSHIKSGFAINRGFNIFDQP